MNPQTFDKFCRHVLFWETGKENPAKGEGLSNDPRDTSAAKCVKPGQYHTNKGVTFCTFKAYAAELGFEPTYQRFLELTSEDVKKFITKFVRDSSSGYELSERVWLSVAELSWLSGKKAAIKTLQKAANSVGARLKVDGIMGLNTFTAVNHCDEQALMNNFWDERRRFLRSLHNFNVYGKGWFNRMNSFLKVFD